jgi:hypothetical protein
MYILHNPRQADAALLRDTHIHNLLPATSPHVAVVWKGTEDDEPPKFSALKLMGKDGNIVDMQYYSPLVDPAIFVTLMPKGTIGYQYGMEYADVREQPPQPGELDLAPPSPTEDDLADQVGVIKYQSLTLLFSKRPRLTIWSLWLEPKSNRYKQNLRYLPHSLRF